MSEVRIRLTPQDQMTIYGLMLGVKGSGKDWVLVIDEDSVTIEEPDSRPAPPTSSD